MRENIQMITLRNVLNLKLKKMGVANSRDCSSTLKRNLSSKYYDAIMLNDEDIFTEGKFKILKFELIFLQKDYQSLRWPLVSLSNFQISDIPGKKDSLFSYDYKSNCCTSKYRLKFLCSCSQSLLNSILSASSHLSFKWDNSYVPFYGSEEYLSNYNSLPPKLKPRKPLPNPQSINYVNIGVPIYQTELKNHNYANIHEMPLKDTNNNEPYYDLDNSVIYYC